MAVLPKFNQGMTTMKYALNHEWHFKSLPLQVFVSLLQISIVFYFEIAKMIIFLQSETLQEFIFNFLALVIIANIDDFVYVTLLERNSKAFIEEKLNTKIQCEDEPDL